MMVASAMAVQDQNGGTGSEIIVPTSLRIPLDAKAHTVKSIQPKEKLTHRNGYVPKVRKPYTITKQRERWTEEEHKKFIEALKLYGRAWRRIEDHVGTKTAVQIRSHAQKFFSKVVRESNSGEESSEKPVEIPPPRPKRKPMHPYPRKLALPTKINNPVTEKPVTSASASACMSVLEQENRSPTSVLSRVASDAQGTSGSNTLNCCPSPVSSATGVNSGGTVFSGPPDLSSEENRSSFSNQANACPNIDEEAAMELLLFSQGTGFSEENSVEASSPRCFKLFGKTVLVPDFHRPSTPTAGTCRVQLSDTTDGSEVEPLSWNFIPAKFSSDDSDGSRSANTCTPAGLCCMPAQKDNLSNVKTSLPWWTSAAEASFSSVRVYSPIPMKPYPLSDNKAARDKDAQKEGSSTGSNSNTGSVSLEGDEDKKSEIEAQSRIFSLRKDVKQDKALRSRPRTATSLERRATSFKINKGFVPYKRCLEDRDSPSSRITTDDRNAQRIRLCL